MHTALTQPLQEYRIAQRWRIIIYLILPPLGMFLLWLALFMPFFLENKGVALLLTPLALGLAALIGYVLLDTLRGRLQVYADRLVQIGPFRRKELLFTNLKGFRATEQYTSIYAIEGTPRRLKISLYLDNYQEFLQWLYQHAPDLDLLEAAEEKSTILENTDFGRTPQERERRLKEVSKVCTILNGAGFLTGLWLLVFPVYYDVAIAVGLLFPLLLILVVYFYRGLITLNDRKSRIYPSLTLAIIMPSLGLALRALLDISLLAYSPLIPAILGFTLIPLLLILGGVEKTSYTKKADYAILVIFAGLFSAYGWGAAVMVNCLYDTASPATLYEAEVLEKRSSGGKRTTYYLKLSAWGPRTEPEDVTVDRELYGETTPGDVMQVWMKPGLLQAPWYVVKPQP
jgi:hypothetical protein